MVLREIRKRCYYQEVVTLLIGLRYGWRKGRLGCTHETKLVQIY